MSTHRARETLRRWDAYTNRNLLGPKWQKKIDERLFAFWFLEKPGVNPHWHGLVMIDQQNPAAFEACADRNWQKLMPSGDVLIDTDNAKIKRQANYITKHLTSASTYEQFITPNEFTTH